MLRALCFLLLFAATAFAAEKNVIFYVADDMSPIMGCYGDKVIKTPNMDALAADGCLFTNAYATTASCSASRSVIMSGLHNHANGQYGHQHDTGHFYSFVNVISLALPRVMHRAGYRTALIGKYHVAPEVVYHYDTMINYGLRNDAGMVEQAKDIIFAKDDKPFFIYIGTHDPHRSGKDFADLPGKPNAFGNLPKRQGFPGVKEFFYDAKEVNVPSFLPDTPECRAELAQYYQSVSRVDSGLGRLVELLKEAGVYDKTMIVVTSDHGMPFPGAKTNVYEPALRVPFIVRNPYCAKRGVRNVALISHVDITPSLLDFAGGLDHEKNAPKNMLNAEQYWKSQNMYKEENRGPVFDHYHGHSWLNILEKEDDPTRNVIYASHTFHEIQMYYPMRVIRDHDYKLIWNIAYPLTYPSASDLYFSSTWQAQLKKGKDAPYGQKTVDQYLHRPAFEFYDMRYDPNETKNLADDPKYAKIIEGYKARLKKFQQEMHDPWVLKWDYE
jgi:N-sulfoglucosamine sulfohydrolase